MGPQKPKWPGAPHFLNPSLIGKTNAELDQNEKINAVVETQQTNWNRSIQKFTGIFFNFLNIEKLCGKE